MLAGGAADHGDADLLRDLEAHLRESRSRDQERNAHLRRLDDHFRGQSTGRVEDLVAAVNAVEPHLAGDRVDRVVPAHVFDEVQDLARAFAIGRERAAVHRAGLLVDRLVHADAVEQCVERGAG